MDNDIVGRLRAGFMGGHVLTEAADEIERLRQQNECLRAALQRIDGINDNPSRYCSRINKVIKDALAKLHAIKATGEPYQQ